MKNIKNIGVLIISFALLAMLGVGCGAVSEDVPKQLSGEPKGRLTFEEKDPEQGIMRGTYQYQDSQIHFDVVRGEKNPWIERMGNSNTPAYAVDVRLCDEVGYCFAMQGGGHGVEDPSWDIASEQQRALAPDTDRARKNERAAQALEADLGLMDREKSFSGLGEEYDALRALGRLASPSPPPPSSYQDNERTPVEGVLSLSAVRAAAATYTHWIKFWWQPLYISNPSGSIFEHSATAVWVTDSAGVKMGLLSTCNHGSCGEGAGMLQGCYRSFANRPSSVPVVTRNCVAAATSGATHPYIVGCCSTPYGFLPTQHVCHDDTRLQRDTVVAGGPLSAPYCADIAIPGYTPSCY